MNYLFAAIIAFAVSAIAAPLILPLLIKLKFGQEIREEGPSWHSKKSGTPTMGGIIFILAAAISCIIMLNHSFKGMMLLYLSVSFGVIGFVDDYIKVVKKQNQGFTAKQKFLLQAVLSVVYVLLLEFTGEWNNEIIIPFTDVIIELPWYLYIPFIDPVA